MNKDPMQQIRELADTFSKECAESDKDSRIRTATARYFLKQLRAILDNPAWVCVPRVPTETMCGVPEVVECDNCGLTTGCMCLAVGIGSGPHRCPACSQPTRNAIPPLQHQTEPADAVSDDELWKAVDRMIVDAWVIGESGSPLDMLAMRKRYDESARHMRGVPAGLKDPETVLAMMLRGMIAVPTIRSMVHLRGEVPNGENVQLLRIAELQEQLDAARHARGVPDGLTSEIIGGWCNLLTHAWMYIQEESQHSAWLGIEQIEKEMREWQRKLAAPPTKDADQ